MAHVEAVVRWTSASAAAAPPPSTCTPPIGSPTGRASPAYPWRSIARALLLALLLTVTALDVTSWLRCDVRTGGGALLQGRGLSGECRVSRAARRSVFSQLVRFAHARPAAADPRGGGHDGGDVDDPPQDEDDATLEQPKTAAPGRDLWGSVAQHTLAELNYDTGLKPFMTPWREVRRMLLDAGCPTTMELPRLTYPPRHRDKHHYRSDPTDGTDDAAPLPALCRKPLVLMSGRGTNCGSCTNFARDVLSKFRAEWEYLRAHVTLVDAGDPMSEQLTRRAYPLWYDPVELRQRLTLTKVLGDAAGSGNTSSSSSTGGYDAGKLRDMEAAMRQSDEADYAIYDTDLRQRAALLMRVPAPQASHRWSRMIKDAYAGQREYLLRIVFAYPHNGSVMRDVVNEAVTVSGSSAKNLHFFTTAAPFFDCAKKAVRVMEWLQSHGDY